MKNPQQLWKLKICSAFRADVRQSLLSQMERYKIAFEGDTLFTFF